MFIILKLFHCVLGFLGEIEKIKNFWKLLIFEKFYIKGLHQEFLHVSKIVFLKNWSKTSKFLEIVIFQVLLIFSQKTSWLLNGALNFLKIILLKKFGHKINEMKKCIISIVNHRIFWKLKCP